MAHRSQSSSVGDNPLDPNYLPPHYREEYRLAIDALVEDDLQGYYEFIQKAEVVDFLSQPEIEHIKSTIKVPNQASTVPELPYHTEALEEDGSSDTYWPMHSDTAAPGLDLGWPQQQHSFIGPTEVTTLVNPSDPDMPSIKEQARRLIKRAQHVIAVVMDMFTDVDIFADLLDAAARHVPVYILLDEHNAHHFVSMVNSCKVNLDLIHMMRVRTVAGVTYFCRTGKSFKGQVKDRFLLADCRAVLSGNYSFMWSYEKLHRCIAHLFLGELVTTFDEEFRILFAQSQPLTIDNAVVLHSGSETSSTSSYFGMKRTQSMRNPRGFLRQPELPAAYPFPGAGDSDRNLFRREDPYRHTMDVSAGLGKFVSSQQFRMQQSFLEQGRSMVSRQMEMSSNAYKRHSYAEGTQESYSSSKQYMKHRVMNNLEETEQHYHREQSQSSHYFQSDGNGPGLGHRQQDRLRGKVPPHLALDHYSDPGYPLELEAPTPPDSYGRDYLSSADLRDDPGHIPPPAGGMYGGGSTQKRPSVGQPYACQSSPTHPHPPEKPGFVAPKEQPDRSQDPSVKQGMRSWRINSYLSTYEDGGEEGLPQPIGPDAFEDPPREPPNAPRPDFKPRFGKPVLPDYKEAGPTTTTRDLSGMDRPSALGMEREKGGEREVGVDVGDGQEVGLSKHESFRMRVNPLLQRSSRLRSSLIFSSSKLETHSGGLGLKTATEEDEELDPLRTTSIVAQILEKRRSMSREPFEWRKKAEEKEKEKEKEKEEAARLKEESKPKEEPLKTIKEAPKNPPAEEEKPKVTPEPPKPAPVMNMNDPASRLQYFKDLAAKRKLSKIEVESTLRGPEPTQKKPDLSDTPPPSTTPSVPKGPCLSVIPPDPAPKKLESTSSTLTGPIHRHSVTSSKPPTIQTRPCLTQPKPSELAPAPAPAPTPTPREDSSSEPQRKEPTKSLKPLPSPKFFKRDALLNPFKSSSNVRTVSCGEEILNTDATDTEKSEQKKMRSHSSSSMTRPDYKGLGSNSSLNQLGGAGETKAETKPLEFLKKQTQRLKGFLGPKDKKSASSAAASGDDKTMSTVPEITEDSAGSSTANHKALAGVKVGPSRYQTSSGSVLFNSNLRDDTKVILEQISANSQQRLEREEAGGEKVSDAGQEKGSGGLEKQSSLRRNRLFVRPQPNLQEREGLLQRIESMRKEKKVYSRFEMGNNLG